MSHRAAQRYRDSSFALLVMSCPDAVILHIKWRRLLSDKWRRHGARPLAGLEHRPFASDWAAKPLDRAK